MASSKKRESETKDPKNQKKTRLEIKGRRKLIDKFIIFIYLFMII